MLLVLQFTLFVFLSGEELHESYVDANEGGENIGQMLGVENVLRIMGIGLSTNSFAITHSPTHANCDPFTVSRRL